MGLLRSEAMRYGMLVLPQNEGLSRKYLDKLGQETSIQFEDMNTHSVKGRPYRRHVQRLDEMERILRFLFEEADRMGMKIVKNNVEEFLAADSENPDLYVLKEVEATLKRMYNDFTQLKANDDRLTLERNQVAEEVHVLDVACKMLSGNARGAAGDEGLKQPLAPRVLKAVAGVINADQQLRFARTVWRATRGNTFAHYAPIEEKVVDPKTGLPVEKAAFVIFCQGSTDSNFSSMQDKVLKLCATFGINNYPWPDTVDEAYERLKDLRVQLNQKTSVIDEFRKHMVQTYQDEMVRLAGPGRNSVVEEWRLFCVKEKSLYHVLNMFEGEQLNVRANCWYAANEEEQILSMLKAMAGQGPETQAAHLSPIAEDEWKTPPTYIRTNDFTDAWQVVINTYGVPRYQEANPALFVTVTFPFIFGMMYGDVGHGTLVMLAGAALIYKGDSLKKIPDIGPILHWVRFLIFELGLFATFAGFLYNDMFSVGLQLFDTRYVVSEEGTYVPGWDALNEGNGKGGPYPFGIDWAWHGATNELLYMNSLKMKLSVLFGVLQMTLGLFLRFGNTIFFKSKVDFFCECVPMLVFMVCFFGWMDFMILYKWVTPTTEFPNGPPGIINSLICMAMGPMGVGQADTQPMWEGKDGGWSSTDVSTMGMNLSMLAIPWLLILKPLFIGLSRNKEAKAAEETKVAAEPLVAAAAQEAKAAEEGAAAHAEEHHGEEEHSMDEIIIHQIIETIEYILGTISHTASYLRIWALSLAHQQLSDVFFTKTISMALPMSFPMNGIAIYIMFTVWFAITCAVLLGMDVLECFLHTLRLHWVEFDSKFFKADGYAFEPFSIAKCIADNDA